MNEASSTVAGQGRLAEVLAGRGGKAAPKPPFVVEHREAMKFAFDLWSYDDVNASADGILERLESGSMPRDGAWPKEKVDVFKHWIQAGKPQWKRDTPERELKCTLC